jgi:hypothetical protein
VVTGRAQFLGNIQINQATVLLYVRTVDWRHLVIDGKFCVWGAAMRKSMMVTPLTAALLVLGISASASAASVTFNFNTLATAAGPTGGTNDAAATSIQGFMNWQLGLISPGMTVSVSAGALADKGYNGDGHVVGTSTNSTSIALGTSENGVLNANVSCIGSAACTGTGLDTYVRNNSAYTSFSFTFNNGMLIDSVKFDYEIFPDATCLTSACGANLPDMTFSTNLGQVFHYYGATPAASLLSPVLPSGTPDELTPQLIGNTGTLVGPNLAGGNVLNFIDWPVTIGIDNLTVVYHTNSAVPEPGSMILLGSGLVGLYARRKKRQAPAATA